MKTAGTVIPANGVIRKHLSQATGTLHIPQQCHSSFQRTYMYKHHIIMKVFKIPATCIFLKTLSINIKFER
jgi:hypothetical protein